ncbi:MAG: folate-binding protein YgfZ [Methylobacillus sp.]|jgi:folate-binding protein YgfZ|nr:folate-binding protein YgfZ [Methylobacillus sp.]
MHSAWQEFLVSRGARIEQGHVVHFGQPGQKMQSAGKYDIIADLSHRGLLRVSGEDAQTFLQGQLTNDMKLLTGGNALYAGYCNPKGRMLALFLVFTHSEHFYLQLNGALKDALMKRLKMYVLRSKVVIEDKSDEVVHFGIAGAEAASALKAHFGSVPEEPMQMLKHEAATLLRLPGQMPRYEIFVRPEYAAALWETLEKTCAPAGYLNWEWREIHAGIPDITPATQEAFVPQMLNLDALGGISFKKGCYTGQEIVARTHYLGKVKRRTHLGHVDSADAPQAGEPVFGSDGAEPAGMIVRVAPAPDGGFDLLYEVRLESLEAGALKLGSADGAEIQPLTLPYAL